MISQENQTTYHFFHKLIVDAFFHKQPAGCDAVLSFVKEHWAHSLKQTHTHTVWIDSPLSLINQQNHEPKWFYHAHSLVHVAVTEDEERGLSSKFQGDFLHVANRTALADKKKNDIATVALIRQLSLASLTFSWCVFQFPWSLWSPVYVHQDGQTGADPPERLQGQQTVEWLRIIGLRWRLRLNLPDPGRMLTTPLGSPALAANSANFSAVSGVTWKHPAYFCSICFERITNTRSLLVRSSWELWYNVEQGWAII